MRFQPLLSAALTLELIFAPQPARAVDLSTSPDGSTPRNARGSDVTSSQSSGSFNVMANGSSGAVELSFPIEVAPGTNGMQPSVSLSYSSASSANSWVGKGWTLDFGAVERSLKHGVPHFDASDTYVLNGEELLADSSVPDRYHTRHESFSRISRVAGTWKVEQPDGTVLRYGLTDLSRIQHPNGMPFKWLLSEISSPDGNVVVFQYSADDTGQLYPREIHYTLRRTGGDDKPLESLAGDPANDRIIRFTLEFVARPDPRVDFAAGFERRLTRRLAHIDVVVPSPDGPRILRRYSLRYTPSWDNGASLLTSIEKRGLGGLPSLTPETTSFTYSTNDPDPKRCGQFGAAPCSSLFTRASGYTPPAAVMFTTAARLDGGVRVADVNHDGRPDLVRALLDNTTSSPGAVAANGAYLNTPSGFSTRMPFDFPLMEVRETNPDSTRFFAMRHGMFSIVGGDRSRQDGFLLQDFTGDGRADVLRAMDFGADDQLCIEGIPNVLIPDPTRVRAFYAGTDTLGTFGNRSGPGVGIFALGLESGPQPLRFAARGASVAELNGDGLPDLVFSEFFQLGLTRIVQNTESYLNRGGGAFMAAPRDALTVCGATGQSCINSATASTMVGARCAGPISMSAVAFGGEPNGKRYFDVNGDGLDDFVSALAQAGQNPVKYVVLNRGAHFEDLKASEQSSDDFSLPPDVYLDEDLAPSPSVRRYLDRGVRMFDVNGDHILDIVQASTTGTRTWLGTQIPGNPYIEDLDRRLVVPASMAFAMEGADKSDRGVRNMDLDADGIEDLIRLDGMDNAREAWLNQAVVPDLLVQVTGPLGGTQSFEYRPSSQQHNPDLAMVVQTVASITRNDRSGNPVVVRRYVYEDGMYDAADREFRGFGTVTEIDARDVRTVTTYHTDFLLQGQPIERTVSTAANELMQRETFEYATEIDPATGKQKLPFPVQLVRMQSESYGDPEGNPAYRASQALTTVVRMGYEAYGNVRFIATEPEGTDELAAPTARLQAFEYTEPALEDRYITNRVRRVSLDKPDLSGALEQTENYYDDHTDMMQAPTQGRLTRMVRRSMTSAPNLETQLTYDEYGNVTQRTGPGRQSTTIHFDSQGLYTFPTQMEMKVDDALSLMTDIEYTSDACSTPLPVAAGLVHAMSDANQNRTLRCYDGRGRLVLEMLPAAAGAAQPTTSMEYTDFAESTDVVTLASVAMLRRNDSGTNVRSQMRLDGFGRPRSTLSDGPRGAQIETVTERNAMDQVRRTSLPEKVSVPLDQRLFQFLEYDRLGRVVHRTEPTARTTTMLEAHGKTTLTDPNGNQREVLVDGFGDVRRVVEHPESGSVIPTDYTYDQAGRLTTIHPYAPDPMHPPVADTIITYDALGQRRQLQDPDLGIVTSTYDLEGNLASQTDARGRTVYFEYDALNRLRQSGTRRDAQDKLVADQVLTYDELAQGPNELGQLTSVSDDAGSHHFRYDELGRRSEEVHVVTGRRFRFAQTYTALGALKSRSFPGPADDQPIARVVTDFDAQGFVDHITEAVSNQVLAQNFSFDGRARIRSFEAGNGVKTSIDFNAATDLLEHTAVAAPDGQKLESLAYMPDDAGLVTSILDELVPTRNRSFGYDGLNRLLTSAGPWGAGGARGTLTFRYDPYGNLTQKDGITRTYGGPNVPAHGIATLGSQSLAYDASGNLTGGLNGRGYRWNERGKLLQVLDGDVVKATYAYDQSGRRASVDENGKKRWLITDDFEWDGQRATIYVTGPSGRLASFELPFVPPSANGVAPLVWLDSHVSADAAGTAVALLPLLLLLGLAIGSDRSLQYSRLQRACASGTLAVFWFWLSAPPVAQAGSGSTPSQLRFYHGDQVGSTTLQTDAAGQIVTRVLYRPFGDQPQVSGPGALPTFAFNGQRLEGGVSLYDYGARFYDPALGRFLSPDALVPTLSDPQSLNRYSYVRNNPVSRIDPTGNLDRSYLRAGETLDAFLSDSLGIRRLLDRDRLDTDDVLSARKPGKQPGEEEIPVMGKKPKSQEQEETSEGLELNEQVLKYADRVIAGAEVVNEKLGLRLPPRPLGSLPRNSYKLAVRRARLGLRARAGILRFAGRAVAGLSLGVAGIQYANGEISGFELGEETAVVLVGLEFGPPGVAAALAYEIGKDIYENPADYTLPVPAEYAYPGI